MLASNLALSVEAYRLLGMSQPILPSRAKATTMGKRYNTPQEDAPSPKVQRIAESIGEPDKSELVRPITATDILSPAFTKAIVAKQRHVHHFMLSDPSPDDHAAGLWHPSVVADRTSPFAFALPVDVATGAAPGVACWSDGVRVPYQTFLQEVAAWGGGGSQTIRMIVTRQPDGSWQPVSLSIASMVQGL